MKMDVTIHLNGLFQLPELLYIAFVLTLLDLVLAGIVSIYQKRFCSSLGYQGLTRKLGFYLVFMILYLATRFSGNTGWLSVIFFNGILLSISVYELASIKRHLSQLNIPHSFLLFIPDDLTVREWLQTHIMKARKEQGESDKQQEEGIEK